MVQTVTGSKNLKKAAAILALFAMFVQPTTAFASGIKKAADITGNQTSNIYFGQYWQSRDKDKTGKEISDATRAEKADINNYKIEGVKYRVLAGTSTSDSSTATGQLFLVSDQALYADQFNSATSMGNEWNTSEARKTLGAMSATGATAPANYNDLATGFAKDAFNVAEYSAIATTHHIAGGGYSGNTSVSDDKLFLLSADEVDGKYGFASGTGASDTRKAAATDLAQNVEMYGNTDVSDVADGNAFWWLRSPGDGSKPACSVKNDGSVYVKYYVRNDALSVRAALNLDSSSILFLSAAAGGKSAVAAGDGFALADYTGTDYKLTLKDTNITAPTVTAVTQTKTGGVDDLAAAAGTGGTVDLTSAVTSTWGDVKVSYTGKDGTSDYVSAIVAGSDGNYSNYAKISAQAAETDKAVGISNLAAGDYKMYIFAEKVNGDKLTDYASVLSSAYDIHAGSVTGLFGTLSSAYKDSGLTINLDNCFDLAFDNAVYDSKVNVDTTGATITADATNGSTIAELNMNGDTTVNNNLTVSGNTSFNNAALTGNVTTQGTTTFDGTSTINGNYSTKEITLNAASDVTASELVTVSGDANFKGAVFSGNMTTAGTTTFDGTNIITGSYSTKEITLNAASAVTASAPVTVSGDAYFRGGNFTGDMNVAGTTNVYKPTTITGNYTAGTNLAFHLDGIAQGATALTITGTPLSLTGKNILLYQQNNKALYEKGTGVTLIAGATGYGYTKDNPKTTTALLEGGGLTTIDYNTYLEGTNLMAIYGSAEPGPTPGPEPEPTPDQEVIAEIGKPLSEGVLAAAAALTGANDMMADAGMDAALSAAAVSGATGAVAFASVQGSHGRYQTGSYVDLNKTQVAAGLAKRFNDSTTAGIFIEGGNGRYSSYNTFNNPSLAGYGELRADGDINYFGGGIFARHEFKQTDKGNAYVDATFGAGHANEDYATENYLSLGSVRYDTSMAYLKAHATVGYDWKLAKGGKIDTYLKYLYTHQNGDTVQFNGGDVDFDAINSHRLRAGFRYAQDIKKAVAWYGGLAYEYEFDATSSATSNGYKLGEPSLKGGSGMAELGLKFKPTKENGWNFDLGLQGFTGKRDTLGVRLGAWYEF